MFHVLQIWHIAIFVHKYLIIKMLITIKDRSFSYGVLQMLYKYIFNLQNPYVKC